MKKKIIIKNFNELKSFKNEYDFKLNLKKHKLISKEEVEKSKSGKFYKVNENYYIKLPRLHRVQSIIAASLAAILIAGSAVTVGILFMPHNVTLKSNYLEIKTSNTARLANDYKCTFKIKEEYMSTQYMNNIKISSIKSNGKEIPVEDYSFIYQTNAKNELTINKKYLGGYIEINADLIKRQPKQNCFWFEYNILEYSDFEDLSVSIPGGEKKTIYIRNDEPQETYIAKFLDSLDIFDETFDIVDNILMKEKYDLITVLKGDYFITESFKFNVPYNMVIVREDNALTLNIKAKEDKKLPKNLWLRSNARFTKKNEDFFLTFFNDYKNATMKIPYFFIRDNGSIAVNPNVEA